MLMSNAGKAIDDAIERSWENNRTVTCHELRDNILSALADVGLAIVPVEPKALEAYLNAACAEAELAVVPIEPTKTELDKLIFECLDTCEYPRSEIEEDHWNKAAIFVQSLRRITLNAAQESTDER